MKPVKLYLAGPMGGLPKFNFPAFDEWTKHLRELGYTVISPHEEDHPEVQKFAWSSETGDMSELRSELDHAGWVGADLHQTMIDNTKQIIGCDGLAMLDGWQKSLGAQHEVAIANRLNIWVAPVELWSLASS